jgi:hypothetical protein
MNVLKFLANVLLYLLRVLAYRWAIEGAGIVKRLIAFFKKFGLETPDRIRTAVDFFCNSATQVILALEGGSREDPAQNWVIHPAIDGCTKLV